MKATTWIASTFAWPRSTQEERGAPSRCQSSSLLGKSVATRKASAVSARARYRQVRPFGTAATVLPNSSTAKPGRDRTEPPAPTTTPISFLRSFSTSCSSSSLQCSSAFDHRLWSYVWSRYPRLRSEDSPNRPSQRTRRYPSPLFDRPPPPNPNEPPRPPPSSSFLSGLIAMIDQRFFSRLPDRFVLYTIFALNILIFISWLYASQALRKFSDPRLYIFLSKNFLSGWVNVADGRWWTMLTACVSHQRLDHFLLNMVSLAFMAPPVLALTGPTTFVLLYFSAGVASSIVSMVARRFVGRGEQSDFSHGASGSVYAIMSTFACVHPTATFLIFFVIPAPAWACVTGIFAWDLWHAAQTPRDRTDSAGHVGGILAGILFWRFGLKGFRIQ